MGLLAGTWGGVPMIEPDPGPRLIRVCQCSALGAKLLNEECTMDPLCNWCWEAMGADARGGGTVLVTGPVFVDVRSHVA